MQCINDAPNFATAFFKASIVVVEKRSKKTLTRSRRQAIKHVPFKGLHLIDVESEH